MGGGLVMIKTENSEKSPKFSGKTRKFPEKFQKKLKICRTRGISQNFFSGGILAIPLAHL